MLFLCDPGLSAAVAQVNQPVAHADEQGAANNIAQGDRDQVVEHKIGQRKISKISRARPG